MLVPTIVPPRQHIYIYIYLTNIKLISLANDREFRRAQQDWESFVMSFTSKLSGLDFTVPELPARDVIFRIYRDTRFSKNPTPYKVILFA